MKQCPYDGCSWRAIAPSAGAARGQYAEHIVEEHARTVDADIPDGMVQFKLESDGDWITASPEEARRLHDAFHDE